MAERGGRTPTVAPFIIRSGLGDKDEVFRILMAQAENHSWDGLIKFGPFFEEYRKDPRFADFCRKVGLPP